MKIPLIVFATSFAIFPLVTLAAEKPLVAHEWGTFTSLQDEAGKPIGGVNTDDEPVPWFVRRLVASWSFFLTDGPEPGSTFKGFGPKCRCHPDVTMRLETPVIYFYPAPGAKIEPFDVHVTFRGGWLTEFYPSAEAKAPGFDAAEPDRVFPIDSPEQIARRLQYNPDPSWKALNPGSVDTGPQPERFQNLKSGFGHLRPDADGELSWKGICLGANGSGPETRQKVWLAPRAVSSAMLQTASGDREKFLFYRGVGNVSAALTVVRNEAQKTLEIRDEASVFSSRQPISAAWLVEVQADGSCAFRSLGALPVSAEPRATVPATFASEDFARERLRRLQEEMRASLVAAGLFPEETEALLRTWELSYFKSPGLRLFYLCPRVEIDRLLPLHISTPCDLTRVMIGRIEIVTPGQRSLLAKIAADARFVNPPVPPVTAFGTLPFGGNWPGGAETGDPYRDLGRFRNALLLDEEKRRPTPVLHDYIKAMRYESYQFAGADVATPQR